MTRLSAHSDVHKHIPEPLPHFKAPPLHVGKPLKKSPIGISPLYFLIFSYLFFRDSYLLLLITMEIRTMSPEDVQDVATNTARVIPKDQIDAFFKSQYTGTFEPPFNSFWI